ncbi:hypothetical protein H4R33_002097 [Dimargaris cristalligena]|uniref:NADH-ubiquinone oxidoreductase 21 kDa subunit n=1 Tax=Dimargaris cristalligena TaxID=215637 RepID=A0A4Q0A146_9FUNG|nr:hypothetical protein H4R33_002097 [Dimargaris cristalligena]RKP39793.1 NADH-ubiquinone oxidoreductase 21 kDa subunit [Dimargaris cristalligena]|eukprot:RKP39793.1 NADH-ubiquinone oxidoreductase 21 kDa subunit [Dimargaris cristalligena]
MSAPPNPLRRQDNGIDPSPRPFEPIDRDPHFARVVRYFRPSDYGLWAGMAALGPVILLGLEKVMPSHGITRGDLRQGLRHAFGVGVLGGFLYIYQKSSYRFMGFQENARELRMDLAEMKARVAKGEELYGQSLLPPDVQRIAAGNSKNSQLLMFFIPWFNLVNHNHHGVDTSKYYDNAEENKVPLAKSDKE